MTDASTPAPSLILGTAGHIDHGKSTLIRALTGTDPDRLAEEKRRGITIELGFAQLALPDGRTMGVVDVPGHERFVRQMIAGATGIDVALLCIAADDGVMPQTVEHLHVLELLGVRTMVVALTKSDLVDAEWAEFMRDEIRARLAETPYASAPIIPVSANDGTGLDELKQAISDACGNTASVHDADGASARLPIDRAFTIKGSGTVVTGTLWSGTVSVDDELELLPVGRRVRVRSVQEHGASVQTAAAGSRTALNLAGVGTDEVRPGMFLATPGAIEPTDRFDAWFTYLGSARNDNPFASGTSVRVAHGTSEVPGRVLLMDGASKLEPGAAALVQVRLEEPLPLARGDRFVARTFSPSRSSPAEGSCSAIRAGAPRFLPTSARCSRRCATETTMTPSTPASPGRTASSPRRRSRTHAGSRLPPAPSACSGLLETESSMRSARPRPKYRSTGTPRASPRCAHPWRTRS